MSKDPSLFSESQTIRAEAAAWLARLDRGLSETELKELQAWINASSLNRRVIFKAAKLWDDMCVLNELSSLFPLEQGRQQRWQTQPRRYAAAAVILIVVVVGGLNFLPNNQQPSALSSFIETQVGEHRIESLPDGSSIQLNTNSQIKIEYTDSLRRIALMSGEAHFDVAHDPERPFIVDAGSSSIRAVGTAFNVQIVSDQVELVVNEGVVSVENNNLPADGLPDDPKPDELSQKLLVEADEKVFIEPRKISAVEKIELASIQAELAWQQGMLVFQGETLTEALAEVSRYSTVDFAIADDDIASIRVAGYFKAGDIDGLLVSLRDNFAIDYDKTGTNQVILTALSDQ